MFQRGENTSRQRFREEMEKQGRGLESPLKYERIIMGLCKKARGGSAISIILYILEGNRLSQPGKGGGCGDF